MISLLFGLSLHNKSPKSSEPKQNQFRLLTVLLDNLPTLRSLTSVPSAKSLLPCGIYSTSRHKGVDILGAQLPTAETKEE